MILAVVFVLFLSSCSGVVLTAWCEDATAPEFSFRPAEDAVEGRYEHRWCPAAAAPASHWQLVISVDDRNATKCVHDPFHSHPIKHSLVSKDIDDELNCTKLCLSVNVDLVYSGCYTVRNTLKFKHQNPINQQKVMYINSSHSVDYYKQSAGLAVTEGKDDTEYVRLSFTRVPVEPDFQLELRTDDPTSTSVQQVAQHCSLSSSAHDARCVLRGLRAARYELTFQHRAAWAHGDAFPPELATLVLAFNHTTEPGHSVVGGAAWYWVWVVAACGAGAACVAGVARAASRPRGKSEAATRNLTAAVDSEPDAEPRDILLLYARDAPQFMRAMQVFRGILETVAPGEVHDIFCPRTVAQYSAGPGAWLRRAVARSRVVLVDTRPASQLYCTTADNSAPLLGTRVLYRAPQYGDELLLAALQLLREGVRRERQYRTLFLCHLSEQPSDMMPHVAHFTRYELPRALPALLRDLAPRAPAAPPPAAPPSPPGLAELAAALDEFLDYAREHPDYLQDILTFLD